MREEPVAARPETKHSVKSWGCDEISRFKSILHFSAKLFSVHNSILLTFFVDESSEIWTLDRWSKHSKKKNNFMKMAEAETPA